jgi:hypothetical protein
MTRVTVVLVFTAFSSWGANSDFERFDVAAHAMVKRQNGSDD